MSDTRRSNGPTEPTDWNAIDWRKANRLVRNLRRRIFRATRENDLKKVRSLQKLMPRSWSNTVLSVRRATQQNRGKETPGVDQVLVKTPTARGELVATMTSSVGCIRQVDGHFVGWVSAARPTEIGPRRSVALR
jgi:RNA-directed DNA polymerase